LQSKYPEPRHELGRAWVRSLIEFRLEDGTSVFVEAESAGREVTRGGRAGGLAVEAGETFESALGRIQPAAIS
jgi:hypothetical protein